MQVADDFEMKLEDICFAVSTRDFDFPFSFYVGETDDFLMILVTDENGAEKIHIIVKSEIVFIKIMYLDDLEILFDDEDNDKYRRVNIHE